MRNETFYKLMTGAFMLLCGFFLLDRVGAGAAVPIASAEPSSVDCVQGKNGIKGTGCSGTVKLKLTSGGKIKAPSGIGLQVNTPGTSLGDMGIYAKQGNGSRSGPFFPVALWGDGTGYGVVGTSINAAGVYGASQFSAGVSGSSENGTGVRGITDSITRAGVSASGAGDTGIALELDRGGIRNIGAGVDRKTPVFIHKVATGGSGNVCAIQAYATVIDHPLTNGRGNAILIVTPNYGANNTGVAPAVGIYAVYYDATNQCGKGAGRWVIYNLNTMTLPNNSLINVLIVNSG